ncbi:NlpC/P60 family protein [Elizabethkingia miricola]|uniref:NlpC/P60 family protein n=1 Tax=Elizabethkingia miricola TaxID=172045 RepID=UPI002ACE3E1F|nr:NlpC/P60 family protein [Elizabethkingia miricola]WQM39435.1 NlpC/P60 family protein [Elizabethkingia miricola]
MKFGKSFHIVLGLFSCMNIYSCNNRKYLRDIPYNYSTEKFSQTVQQRKKQVDSIYYTLDDNPEKLTDDILKIKEKYSIILNVMPRDIRNYRLYCYIDEWLGTSYKKQMLEKQIGVDTSYFIQALSSDIYNVELPKTADGIFRSKSIQLFTGRRFLREGDILFFRYNKLHPISDVGIYLHNGRILACTHKGFNIYNFNDEYFQLRYVAAGRLKRNL